LPSPPHLFTIHIGMRKFLLPFCILIPFAQPAFAVVTECDEPVNGKCQNGCVYDGTFKKCSPCSAGTYYDGGGCTYCPDEFPESPAGSTSELDCRAECTTEPYDPCGYHYGGENGRYCIPNKTISDDGLTMSIWNNGSTTTYTIGCAENEYFKERNKICDTPYGDCIPYSIACSVDLECDKGQIYGNATLSTSTYTYDYTACTCNSDSINGPNGKYRTECTYIKGSGAKTEWDCQVTATECNTGFCVPAGETECATVPAGYYSVNTSSTECTKCPLGSMSEPGATAIIQCYIERGKTRFSDNNGTIFTLPGSGNLNYAPRAP